MPIEDFVKERKEDAAHPHPLLRLVEARRRAGDVVQFELRQPPEQIGYRKASIYLHFARDGRDVDLKRDEWDDELNTALVRAGVKAVTPDGEKDRFALGLRAALRRPEKRFGDGYFNAVLVEFVKASDFRGEPVVAQVLSHIPVNPPEHGRTYPDCRDMIEAAIRGRGVELTTNLGYPIEEAAGILAGALARYLDERFSVSRRRLLGLL